MSETNSDSRPRFVPVAGLLCREAAGDSFRQVLLSSERFRIGRRFENDLIVSHASVSRFHAEILWEGGNWYVVDCDSKFGTSVNGERIVRAALVPGDEIRIGTEDGPLIVFSPSELPDRLEMAHPDARLQSGGTGGSMPASEAGLDGPPHSAVVSDSSTPSGDALRLVEKFRATSLIGDYHEALALVADAALELTHFDRAALLLVDRATGAAGAVRLEVARTRSGRVVAVDSRREAACAEAVVENGLVVQIDVDAERMEGELPIALAAASAGIERIVCLPLLTPSGGDLSATNGSGPRTVGALYLEAGPGAPRADGVRAVLESLASEAAHVVERLYHRQRYAARARVLAASRIAERTARAGDALLPLVTRAKAVCELLPDLLTVGDLNGATLALEPFEEPDLRAQLPDNVRADVLKAIGIARMWQGAWHRAVGLLNEALAIAIEGQNVVLEMSIRASLARCYAEICEYAMARDNAMTAVSVLRRIDESSVEYARALLALGVLEHAEGDSVSAIHAFRLALRVAERADDLLALATAHYRLGLLQFASGDTTAAIAAFQAALEAVQPTGNVKLALVGQVALATALVRSGAWLRAESVIGAALDAATEPLYGAIRARLHLLAASIAVWRDGADAAADSSIDRLRAAVHGLDDAGLSDEVDLLQAELCLDRSDPAGARRCLLNVNNGAPDGLEDGLTVRARLLLAEVERLDGNADEARRQIVLAQRSISGMRDLGLAGLAQRAEGRLNADRGLLTEAQHRYAQALSIFRTLDDRRQIGCVHFDLGNLMLAANDAPCARTHLQMAHSICSDLGMSALLARVEARVSLAAARVSAESPPTYSSTVLSARSEPRFVRRLLEASQSRDLMLRELTSIAIDVARSKSAVIVTVSPDGSVTETATLGDRGQPWQSIVGILKAARGEIVREREGTIYPIEPAVAESPHSPVTVLAVDIALRESSRHDLAMQSVVQMVRQGLELIRLRASLKRADLPSLPMLGAGNAGDGGAHEPSLIYVSAPMRLICERIHLIRSSSATVLVTGESGVGKELVARAIHSAGPNSGRPFVPFNCSAAPRDLIESQLFGHRKGAFTGATADSPGVARAARGGTLFLDEVGDLPLELQPKLLRFLEYGEIQPLGGPAPLHVDVRLVAATNADLERAVSERRFREDLFHRLNIIRLHVPPLRERPDDIPLLVSHFLQELSARAGHSTAPSISEEALSAMVRSRWPGNVRQLRNEVERLVTFHPGGSTITRDNLSPEIQAIEPPVSSAGSSSSFRSYDNSSIPLADRLRLFEIELISRALSDSEMNLTHAADSLGMARQNLQRRVRKLGLRPQTGDAD